MSDIRDYLKELSDNYESGDYVDISAYNYFQMAYDEIERLKERIKKLEATLRMRWPFDVPLEADDE